MPSNLVLSLFPGIGLLDRAFELEGFCIVRGPDLIWGGDIRTFHPPAGVFAGVIGGPPCQSFSALAHLVKAWGREPRFGNLIPEFERCVTEAQPEWFVMENVPGAPLPVVEGYQVHAQLLNNRWLGEEQNRVRRISFGTRDGQRLNIQLAALEAPVRWLLVNDQAVVRLDAAVTSQGSKLSQHENARVAKAQNQAVTTMGGGHGTRYQKVQAPAVVESGGGRINAGRENYVKQTIGSVTSADGSGQVKQQRYTLADACRLQGLPEDFLADCPLTAAGKLKAVANGVPIPMGRAIAVAVRKAMGYE